MNKEGVSVVEGEAVNVSIKVGVVVTSNVLVFCRLTGIDVSVERGIADEAIVGVRVGLNSQSIIVCELIKATLIVVKAPMIATQTSGLIPLFLLPFLPIVFPPACCHEFPPTIHFIV